MRWPSVVLVPPVYGARLLLLRSSLKGSAIPEVLINMLEQRPDTMIFETRHLSIEDKNGRRGLKGNRSSSTALVCATEKRG